MNILNKLLAAAPLACLVMGVLTACDNKDNPEQPGSDVTYTSEKRADFIHGEYLGTKKGLLTCANYSVIVSDKNISEDGQASPDAICFVLDLYGPALDANSDLYIPEGEYILDEDLKWASQDPWTFSHYSYAFTTEDNTSGKERSMKFKEGKLKVEKADNGFNLALTVRTYGDTVYIVSYTGVVELLDNSGEGSRRRLLRKDLSDIVLTHATAAMGDEDGDASIVTLTLGNMDSDEEGNPVPPGQCVNIDLRTTLTGNKLATGTYSLDNDGSGKSMTFEKGIISLDEDGNSVISGSYATDMVSEKNIAFGPFVGGNIIISDEADDRTKVTLDIEMEGGYRLAGTYTGELSVGEPHKVLSMLTSDYEADMSSSEEVYALFQGDYFETGAGNWDIQILPGYGSSDVSNEIRISLCGPDLNYNGGNIPEGFYTVKSDYSFMSAAQGTYNEENDEWGCTYLHAVVDGKDIYAPAYGGTVEVRKNFDGTYTFIFNFTDDAVPAHKFYGEWTGTPMIMDFS